jgi:hypothetical protein
MFDLPQAKQQRRDNLAFTKKNGLVGTGYLYFTKLTPEQKKGIKAIYDRSNPDCSYRDFRKHFVYTQAFIGNAKDCETAFVYFAGMVLGIERDGYTHS